MLATVLALPRDSEDARINVWRQLVDLLAQHPELGADSLGIDAYRLLEDWREDIPTAIRTGAARGLAGRVLPVEMVDFFVEDRSEVAAPLLLEGLLSEEEWIELLPGMPSNARALLRHRTDLPQSVRDALSRYGAADMILESSGRVAAANDADAIETAAPEEPQQVEQGPEQIRRLVERIEAFREKRSRLATDAVAPQAEEFRFETGRDGIVRWIEGAPRGPLIGLSIAHAADALEFGVDGQAAGAFRARAPFRDARLMVAGEGAAAGAWRMSAAPFFDDRDGRFAGYRGMARRPRRGEDAGTGTEPGLFGSTLAPDSLRQLIHELRTPLNAIIGFAEMIEQQLLGPLADIYRDRARMIAIEAGRLLDSVDDLDTAARVETDRLSLGPETVDVTEILTRLHDGYVAQAEARRVALIIRIEEGLPDLDTDAIAAERMIERLLAATVGLAESDERIVVRCRSCDGGDTVAIAFDRPMLLDGRTEEELLDPGYSPAGDWPDAPALGLGFALRLVRNVAREAGGRLEITEGRFVLYLPAKDASACSGEQGC